MKEILQNGQNFTVKSKYFELTSLSDFCENIAQNTIIELRKVCSF